MSRQDKIQFIPHFETGQNCFVLSSIQFTPPTRTRQDKTVLACPRRRCVIGIRLDCYCICCYKLSCLKLAFAVTNVETVTCLLAGYAGEACRAIVCVGVFSFVCVNLSVCLFVQTTEKTNDQKCMKDNEFAERTWA